MKIFFSEYRHDYTTYTFGYTQYAVFEQKEDINEIYKQGFLPYTGNIFLQHDLFYKSRGIRIDLNQFKDSSENRRVDRKVQPLRPSFELIPIERFKDWDHFFSFSIEYSSERIGEQKMPSDRLKYIVQRKYLTHVIQVKNDTQILAYILAVISKEVFHYWFAFYDASYLAEGIPLGKWLMWKGIHIAKDLGCNFCYLGNGYNETSLYKTRDFTAVQFFDGNTWNTDTKLLSSLCHGDKILKTIDDFKTLDQPDHWLNKL